MVPCRKYIELLVLLSVKLLDLGTSQRWSDTCSPKMDFADRRRVIVYELTVGVRHR